MHILPINKYSRQIIPPPDKSETIRAIIISSIARGVSFIKEPLIAEDTLSALRCVKALGADVVEKDRGLQITPNPIVGHFNLDAGNSATTLRLLAGMICGMTGVDATITGDNSLSSRSNAGLIEALKVMGGKLGEDRLPIKVTGGKLNDVEYVMPRASAQIKGAMLMAALTSGSKIKITQPLKTRDHTETLMKAMGANIEVYDKTVVLHPSQVEGISITIGGDPSSAAFPLVLGLLTGGEVKVYKVAYSIGRMGFIDVLRRMGAEITIEEVGQSTFGSICDISCRGSLLRPFCVESDEVPSLIDEIPLLSISACFVNGTSKINGAIALRNKESDRIKTTVEAINAMGGRAYETDEGLVIEGKGGLRGGKVNSYGDHRIAMSAAVGLLASQEGGAVDVASAMISYPDFLKDIL